MITARLLRAARALLDWQQGDLAKAANVSLSAVKDFENGSEKTRFSTQKALQGACETHGVEFPVSGGVRLLDEIAEILRFTGPDFMQKWNEDIFLACRASREKILTSSIDEGLWTRQSLVQQANQKFLAWMEQTQTTVRSLVPEGHDNFNLPRKSYRVVPA
ncbi:MAG TPA: hypothetical protein DD400_04315, partial [Rhodospirillaceae bacterium]|nr:hypothetical protein [Rhodospirillaceae bacterium]